VPHLVSLIERMGSPPKGDGGDARKR